MTPSSYIDAFALRSSTGSVDQSRGAIIAAYLAQVAQYCDGFSLSGPTRSRRRKPSIKRLIAAAERDGRKVTSVTTPDGVTLHFGKVEDTEANNPWLDDLKVTKQ